MADGNALLALTLGLGGGLALAYMRRAEEPSTIAAVAKSQAPAQKPPAGAKACFLRLDARGLTADGLRVDVAGAVARCKASGRAEIIFAKDAPAAIYGDLNRALSRAGISVRVSGG